MNRWICDILLFCVLLFSVQAMAQENAENREAVMKKQAIADYKEGSKAFYDRDFDQALLLFTKAYRVIKNPVMVYNIARCFEEKKDFASAVKFYREYLDASQSADDKIEVVLTINVLESLMKPEVTVGSNHNQLWGWTALGVGGILLLGGTITGLDVLDKTDQLNGFAAMDSLDRYQSIQESRNNSALLTDTLFVGSVIFSSIGAYLLINQFSDPKANYQPKTPGMKPISIQQSFNPFSFSF